MIALLIYILFTEEKKIEKEEVANKVVNLNIL